MATMKLERSEAPFEVDRPTWLEPLLDAVRQLRFGSVEITVHDGRIVQIERKEKLCFETSASPKER
jgi:hypothetical protein